MLRKYALLLVVLLNGVGMAHAGLFTDDEAQLKIGNLQQKVQMLEDKLNRLESLVQNQGMVDLLSQVDALKGDMAKLRGQIEVQTHEIEGTQKRQKDFYVDLDTRVRRLESAGPVVTPPPAIAPPVSGVPPKKGAAGSTPTVAPVSVADPALETRAYESALGLFKVGNYQGAIAGFQDFMKSYPSGNLASSAQYWIGNAYFALHDFKASIAAQQKLVSQYPASQKVPDAMLNIASSQQELGDSVSARKTLEELVAKYPISPAAELAQKRLGNLK